MKRFFVFFFLILAVAGIEMCAIRPAFADGTSGLNYTTYAPNGSWASPNQTTLTPLTSGIVQTINYGWDYVLDSGRNNGVVVKFTGYFKADNTGTYYLGLSGDDGYQLIVNGQYVVNYWADQGNTFRSGSINLTAGQVVPITIWYYENGGGAVLQFYWYTAGGWQIVPSSMLATDPTFWAPILAGGATSAAFINAPANTAKVTAYKNRTTADAQVYIEQLGNSNTITVDQTGTKNNYAEYYGNGSGNTVSIKQSSTSPTAVNYTELRIVGNTNTANITQQSTGGEKSAFVTINDSNNSVLLTQKDSGSHYAEVTLAGGNKNVDILQQGSGNHQAKVGLTGLPVDLSLSQTGSTQQSYSINFNCATAGGCQKISVSQGQ